MEIIAQYFIVIALSLAFGSFISAFTYRFHEKKNWMNDRSMCVNCKHTLGLFDLFPIFSYILLHGRCRYCHKTISPAYPLMELSVVLSFLLLSTHFSIFSVQFLLYAVAIFFLLILSWYDFFYHEIIDQIAIPMIIVLTVLNFNLTSLILAVCVFILFVLIVTVLGGMGGGDIRIAVIAALLTGWPNFVIVFEAAVISALFYGILTSLLKNKNIKDIKKSAVPLIPFFTFGILIAIIYGDMIVKEFLKI